MYENNLENKSTLYTKYFLYILLSLVVTIIGAFSAVFLLGNGIFSLGVIALGFINILTIIAFMFTKGKLKQVLFFVFCFVEGITLTPIIAMYTTVNLLLCLVITFILVFVFGLIGFLTKKNLSILGQILFASLFLLIFYMLFSLFIPLPSLAIVGVILFSLYVLYDMNNFKRLVDNNELYDYAEKLEISKEDVIITCAMDMYLNILNLLLFVLELVGDN